MPNRIDTKIVLGSKRFQSATDNDILINVPLDNTQKEINEFDRNNVVSLAQVFDDERQESSIFRIISKIDFLFYNAYSGTTDVNNSNYTPFTNNLFYVDAENSFSSNSWSGYPLYSEFDLIRLDNNIPDYTTFGTNPPHVDFVNKSATTYNWTQYISYAFENNYNKTLQYYRTFSNSSTWVSGDGIPFYITNPYNLNGQNLISFVCPVEHNLIKGEWVEINLPGWNGFNGLKVFQVYSLGQSGYDSEKYIFNIYNNGFPTNVFPNSAEGTFKRIIDINNSAETKSKYYVRNNKIITDVSDAVLTKAAFDQNGFRVNKQFEYSSLTPTHLGTVSIKENNQSYLLSFSKDIDISKYRDNLNRPLSEIFITIINRGYFGWMNMPLVGNSPNPSIRIGYKYNIESTSSPYWSVLNDAINTSNIKTDSYTKAGYTFYYNQILKSGDTIDGDFCEFNQFEQKERVISPIYHKLWINPLLFQIQQPTDNPDGYYYKPHNPITLRVYSDYIEEGSMKDTDGIPDYAYYSDYYQKLRWRDLYTFGYIDESGIGVNYPFINGTHYPSDNIIFRVFPEGNVPENIYTISKPITDDCE